MSVDMIVPTELTAQKIASMTLEELITVLEDSTRSCMNLLKGFAVPMKRISIIIKAIHERLPS
jgi:hypothetical protein